MPTNTNQLLFDAGFQLGKAHRHIAELQRQIDAYDEFYWCVVWWLGIASNRDVARLGPEPLQPLADYSYALNAKLESGERVSMEEVLDG